MKQKPAFDILNMIQNPEVKIMHKNHEEICKLTKNTGKAEEFFKSLLAFTVSPDRLKHLMEKHLEEYTLVDLREYDDYIKGHIPFAIHVPFDQLEEQTVQFSKDRINIVYGYSPFCQLAKKAAYHLAKEGYPVRELWGGFKAWKKRDFDIVENESGDYQE